MRVVNVVMTDKEFDIYWKRINQWVEESEEHEELYMKLIGDIPENFYKGIFGLPESFFDTVKKGADIIGKSNEDVCSTWRFIQAVLKG